MFIPRGSIRHGLMYDLLINVSIYFKPSLLMKVTNKTREKTSKDINNYFYPYKSHLLPYARTSLHALIKSLDIPKGSEVLMTPFNIYPMLNVIKSLELKIKFIDINLYDYGPDYDSLDNHLSRKPAFFLLTYLFGYVPNMKLITEKCEKYNVKLIEDFSQSVGAKYNKKLLGTFGFASFYSSSLTKYIDGYNGSFLLNKNLKLNSKIDKYLISLCEPMPKRQKSIILKTFIWNSALNKIIFNIFTFPILWILKLFKKSLLKRIIGANITQKKDIILPQYYFEHISEIQTRTIHKYLKNLPKLIAERKKCFKNFEAAYKEIEENKKLRLKKRIYKLNNYKGNVYWQLVIKVKDTEIAQDILFSHGIETGITNLPNLASEFGIDLPNSISLKNNHIFIPLHTYLNKHHYKKMILKLIETKQI